MTPNILASAWTEVNVANATEPATAEVIPSALMAATKAGAAKPPLTAKAAPTTNPADAILTPRHILGALFIVLFFFFLSLVLFRKDSAIVVALSGRFKLVPSDDVVAILDP